MAQKGTYLKGSLFVVVAAAWAPQMMSSAIDWVLKMRVGGADTPVRTIPTGAGPKVLAAGAAQQRGS